MNYFIRRVAENIRIVLEGPLFYQLIGFVGLIAFTLLFLDQSKDQINYNMILGMNCLCTQSLLNFIACYFADRLEEDLLEIKDVTYNLLWYKFAYKEREFLPWIIRRAQKSIRLSGFTIIDCSLATFMMLFRSAGSYYLIFRQLAE